MKRYLHILVSVISLCCLFTACDSNEAIIQETYGTHQCRLVFTASVPSFNEGESTRANTDSWADNSCVYLTFTVGASKVDGKAIYNKVEDEWTLYYNGAISNGTTANCKAVYFENNYSDDTEKVSLSQHTAIYSDDKASYSKTSEAMMVNASLLPLTGRIRFMGDKGKEIHLSGFNHYTMYNKANGDLQGDGSTVDLVVGDGGYTPYIYPYFSTTSRKMVLAYSNLSFSTECEHPILDEGKSGYMEIPTEEKHNGWDMIKMSLPSVSSVTINDIGVGKVTFSAKLLDDGNGTVSDCGFCYSTSANPTTSDAKISYGKATGEFGKTVTGLTENTEYHVRAYAINELGTAYGEDVTFKTKEVTVPVLSAVTMGTVSNTSAEVEATVTSLGNGTLVDAGFVYSLNPYPTLDDKLLSCGKNTSLKSIIKGLQPETKYYIRAYATNEKGTAYGAEKIFTTTKNVVNPYTTITVETSYGSVQFDMAKVDGGTFTMGAQNTSASQPNYDSDADSDEKPTHSVTLSPYYIGKTEVTQQLWYVVMGSYPNISSTYGRGDDYPVYNVTYSQCEQFIKKLNTLTGKTFRLPTEAEWEFAARGGKNTNGYKYSGNTTVGTVAWYGSNSSNKTHPVAQKTANEINVFDMSGNVWEWCSDWYGNYSISSQTDPTGATSGSGHVIRGGAYNDAPTECRVTVRSYAAATSSFTTLGLRLVME